MMIEDGENEVVVVDEIEEGEEEGEKKKRKGGVMRWENILHRMFIRVMLVEADDSTRQIIAALLRKCGYKVAAIPDGLKAWETLKGKPNNIDLILTEVELPSVSGFDLLTMIMEHEICKNIPVIMMSSHDTMSMIFNCMLRGAADFLVKPIRKNELRNLWQHIWRRQSSTGNSHGPQDGSFAQQRIEAPSENKASSKRSSSYFATGQKSKEFSEKESDTHSTCTKPNVEAESTSVHDTQDFLILSTARLSDTKLQNHRESVRLDEEKLLHEIQEDASTYIEEQKGGACNEDISSVEPVKEHGSTKAGIQGKNVPKDCHWEDAHVCDETEDSNSECTEASSKAIDLIGTFGTTPHVYRTVVQKGFSSIGKTHLDSNDISKKLNSNLLLELSLRRSHPSDHGNQHSHVRNTWNHSNASAFSRYTNKSPQPFSTCAEPTERVEESSKHVANQCPVSPPSASKCNGDILERDQQEVLPVICLPSQAQAEKPCPVIPLPVPVRSIVIDSSQSGYGAVLSPMFCKQSGWPQSVSPSSASKEGSTFDMNSSRQCDPKSQNADRCHLLNEQRITTSTEHSEHLHQNLETGKNLVCISPGAGQSGTGSVPDGATSYPFNSNGCGSFSNGRIENVTPTGVARVNGRNEGLLSCNGIQGINTCRSSQREAALNKFRLKRKDRCFEKKVRYESRQKLAEQRPRVKGQFVRQVPANPPLLL